MDLHGARALTFVVALSWIGIAAAGCIPHVNVAPTTVIQSDSDAYFVMGASPDNYVYWVGAGEIVAGEFHQDTEVGLLPPVMWKSGGVGYPDHGYLVAKARAGATLAVTGIQYENRIGLPGPLMIACTTYVFTVPPGKVVYVGHLSFTAGNRTYAGRRYVDFAAAKGFVAQHYPLLADRLVEGRAELMTTGGCRAAS
jgi:hypothetical protein